MILGADKYSLCLLPGLQRGVLGTLTAQATVFGWILSGPVMSDTVKTNIPLTVHQSITAQVLHEDLTKFWGLEELPNRNPLSNDEKFCEENFLQLIDAQAMDGTWYGYHLRVGHQ